VVLCAENVHQLFWGNWFAFDSFFRVNPAASRAPLIQILFDMMPAEEADLLKRNKTEDAESNNGKILPDNHKHMA